jgi:hypothetical protein
MTAPSLTSFRKKKGLTQNPKIWKITTTMMKKGETHLRIINLGWPEMVWPSLDEYITFLDIQRSYSLSLTLRPQDCLKIISINSSWQSG